MWIYFCNLTNAYEAVEIHLTSNHNKLYASANEGCVYLNTYG